VQTLYPRLIETTPHAVAAYQSAAEFLDVGTAQDYLDTVAKIAAREQRPFDRGSGVSIAPGGEISETVIWDRVTIGRGVRLHRCIVADDVTIPDGMQFEHRAIVAAPHGFEAVALR
jgi:NDP-sugar pyrophosphorylase family protein